MRYTESHEWISVDGPVGTVGITEHAKNELGDIVYIELPKVGNTVQAGDAVCVLESTKAAVDIYAPVSGEIVAVNDGIKRSPSSLQGSSKSGWLFEIKLSDLSEVESLLTASDYEALHE